MQPCSIISFAPPSSPSGGVFLGRLEDELDGALELVAHRDEDLGDTHQDRNVRVMPACMHHAGFGAVPFGAHCALERYVGLFGDGQCIHVGAQRDTRTGLAALEHSDNTGVGDLLLDLIEADALQMRGNQLRRFELAITELGIRVDVAPPGDDLLFEAIRVGGDHVVEQRERIGCVHWVELRNGIVDYRISPNTSPNTRN
jgi:hypothetical protein